MKKTDMKPAKVRLSENASDAGPGYGSLLGEIASVIDAGRHQAVWSLNAIISAVYWDIGRRIVLFEQEGRDKAAYGEKVIDLLALDLSTRFGRGFKRSNLFQIRAFYLAYRAIVQTPEASSMAPLSKRKVQTPSARLAASKVQTLSGQLVAPASRAKVQTPSGQLAAPNKPLQILQKPTGKTLGPYLTELAKAFSLPWSHYVRLLSTKSEEARRFYETEALRNGWSFRELDRQISSQLYERLALSRNKAALLRKAEGTHRNEPVADAELRDPFVLEFLNLRDEYSESDLEDALIQHLSEFLVELGHDFCFVARQRRLRVGGEWYRVDLIFFHRKLRCLVVIDLKVGKFTHADAGQMHLYLNYAREHWTQPGENPPVGLILCAEKDDAVAKYALEGLPNKVLAREYKLALPEAKLLAAEIEKTRVRLERRGRK
jgi:predicted nuclease of restriction endonuclease-like (RecB) superfamily